MKKMKPSQPIHFIPIRLCMMYITLTTTTTKTTTKDGEITLISLGGIIVNLVDIIYMIQVWYAILNKSLGQRFVNGYFLFRQGTYIYLFFFSILRKVLFSPSFLLNRGCDGYVWPVEQETLEILTSLTRRLREQESTSL